MTNPPAAIECDGPQAHAAAIAAYNQWACAREPYAQRVRRWRAQQQADQADATDTTPPPPQDDSPT